jgi:hypothetical protein
MHVSEVGLHVSEVGPEAWEQQWENRVSPPRAPRAPRRTIMSCCHCTCSHGHHHQEITINIIMDPKKCPKQISISMESHPGAQKEEGQGHLGAQL